MNRVAAFALRRKNSILSMSEKMFCPPQPLRFWITPAYAEKRIKLRKRHSICGDHPRVCGEKSYATRSTIKLLGSPPRVRGKAVPVAAVAVAAGITPAYAGKSTHQPPSGRGTRGHPRVCGEKCGYRLPFRSIVGSPPTVRGKVAGNLEQGRVVGITPAYAGKRIKLRKRHSICGEKLSTTSTDIHPAGSPPRMRGKGQGQGDGCDHQGITPAHAGKRSPMRPSG